MLGLLVSGDVSRGEFVYRPPQGLGQCLWEEAQAICLGFLGTSRVLGRTRSVCASDSLMGPELPPSLEGEVSPLNALASGLMQPSPEAGSPLRGGARFARKCLCSPWAPEPDAKSGFHLGRGSSPGPVPG